MKNISFYCAIDSLSRLNQMAATALIVGELSNCTFRGYLTYVAVTSTIGAAYKGCAHISACPDSEKIFTDRLAQDMFDGALWGPIMVPPLAAAGTILFMAKLFE